MKLFIRLLQFLGVGMILFAFTGCADMTDTQMAAAPMPVNLQSGETVSVQTGDTVYSVARRYKVPMSDVIALNQLKAPFILQPGSSLVLPAKDIMITSSMADNAPLETKVIGGKARQPKNTPVEKAQGMELYRQVAVADERGKPESIVNEKPMMARPVGQTPQATPQPPQDDLVIYAPASQRAMQGIIAEANRKPVLMTAPERGPSPITQQLNLQPMAYDQRKAQLASTSPVPPAALKPPLFPKRAAAAPMPPPPDKMVMPGRFIWPVHGQMISGYGPKPGGLRNDGVNIGVPMGTPVAASDGGTVAYAGNDIPGFGNVVMVRHAGGWITAYGHLERILVARDTIVAKGDIVGTAGTSGGLTQPQVHFEIRKGAEALDPERYLAAGM